MEASVVLGFIFFAACSASCHLALLCYGIIVGGVGEGNGVSVGIGDMVAVGGRVAVGDTLAVNVGRGVRVGLFVGVRVGVRVGVMSASGGYNSCIAPYQLKPLVNANSVKRAPA